MPTFGRTSRERLKDVYPPLVEWAWKVVSIYDCSVVYGVRTIEQQRHMVDIGASRTMNSFHLIQADGFCHAIDLAPYPIKDWNDYGPFWDLIWVGLGVAKGMGLPIINGRDWDGDLDFDDQTFNDFMHWQTVEGL